VKYWSRLTKKKLRSILTYFWPKLRPKIRPKLALFYDLFLGLNISLSRPTSSPLLSSLTFSKWSKKETRTSLLLLRSKLTKFSHLLRPNFQRFKLLTVVVFFRVIISSVGLASQTCLRLTRLRAHIIVLC